MKINYFQQGGSTPYRTSHPESAYDVRPEIEILYDVIGPLSLRTMMDLAVALRNKAMLQPKPITFNSVNDDIVNQVIRGKFGNGLARIDALTAAGYDPKEVLAAVNTRLRNTFVAPKQGTIPTLPVVEPPTLPAIETPAVAPGQQPATPTLASPVVAPAPIRNQVSTNPTNPNKQMMVGSDYRQYRRDFAKKNGLVFAPNLFGELGNKKEQFTNPKTNRLVSEQELARLGWNPYYKEGGKINYFQQGGQIQQDPDPTEQVIQVEQVIQGLRHDPQGTMQLLSQMQGQQGGKEQVNAILQEIIKRAKSGDQQAVQAVQVLQQAMQGGLQTQAAQQQAPAAKNGAKLNYLKQLKGKCPEGEELVYMKKGGTICPVCQKKKGGEVKNENKKQFFGKDKQVKKEEDGGKAKNDSITATQRRSKSGNEVGTEKHDNGLTRSFMQGPALSNPYFMQINRGDTTVTTTGPQLGAQYQTTPSQRQEAINFFNTQDTLPLLYKQRVSADAAMYKSGGKTQFFKKEQKKPLDKCGGKMKAKKK